MSDTRDTAHDDYMETLTRALDRYGAESFEVRNLLTPFVPVSAVVREARSLRSEAGENAEYDRALVELVMRTLGWTDDDRKIAERLVLG